jgi:acyl carrier protein
MPSSQSADASLNQDIEDVVSQLVASALGKKRGGMKPEDPLFSSQSGFDSFSLLELVLRLEDTFGLNIPDEDLDPDIFHSVRSITSYVAVRLDQRD